MIESTIGKPGYEPARITIYVKDRGIVLEESSMALVNRDTGLIIAMGNAAEEAIDQAVTPVTAVNPLRRGIIASYMLAERMFCSYLRRALGYDRSMVKRLTGATEKAFMDAFYQAGARDVCLTGQPLEEAVRCLEKPCTVFVGITWNGKEKERFCINENCPHRIF